MTQGSVGRYQIVRELGRGGMGVVYEVADPGLPGRRLALKQMLKDLAGAEALQRFAREAELLARIRHPNVVQVHACALDPIVYLVTELVEGESLHTLAARGLLTAEQAAQVVAALADAVGTLHDHGILHRDLKPENVIVRPDGTPVLLDFGLARELDAQSMTQTGVVLGTPAFMPPEQADGRKDIDERADVYGLGAILFSLLAGEPPFRAESSVQLIFKVLKEEPEWALLRARQVPEPLRTITQRAMARERDGRYPSAQAFAADLRRFLGGEEVLARPPRSHTPLLAAGGVALLLLVGGALAFALRGGAPPTPTPATPRPSASQAATPTPTPLAHAADVLRLPPAERRLRTREFAAACAPGEREEELAALAKEPLWERAAFPRPATQPAALAPRGAAPLGAELALTWWGGAQRLVALRLSDGTPSWELELDHLVQTVAVAPDASQVLVFEGAARVTRLTPAPGGWGQAPQTSPWELPTQRAWRELEARAAAFDPAGQRLLLGLGTFRGSVRGALLLIEDLAGTPRVQALGGLDCLVHDVLWSPDGRLAACGLATDSDRPGAYAFDLSGEAPRQVYSFTGIAGIPTVFGLAWGGPDLYLAEKGCYLYRVLDRTTWGRGAEAGQRPLIPAGGGLAGLSHSSQVTGVASSAEGAWIYSVCGRFEALRADGAEGSQDAELRVWERSEDGHALRLDLPLPTAARTVKYLPELDALLIVLGDGRLQLHDAWLLRELGQLRAAPR